MLKSSEDAAVKFYVYRVIDEVVNDQIRTSTSGIYGSSSDQQRFNLHDALMEKSEFDNSEHIDRYSQKYFERKAKLLIRQFTKEKISVDENGYKPAFELYTYIAIKQLDVLAE
ncbi:hypothetical protein [Aliamphritea spongicola]|nr:hypothetical protein [Aliamphritea spongicola]